MRRSAVVSARKFKSPVIDSATATSTPLLPVRNAVRSTADVIHILTKNRPRSSKPPEIRRPKSPVPKDSVSATDVGDLKENSEPDGCKVYSVVWGKRTMKKHKTWEGDGTLKVIDRTAILRDVDGNEIGRATYIKPETIEDGAQISVGNKEVLIGNILMESNAESHKRKRDDTNSVERNRKRAAPGNFLSMRALKARSNLSSAHESFVMPVPPAEHQSWHNKHKKPIVEVSIDYCLSRVLRAHQRAGLIFLYECVLGFRKEDCYGAILADEMGLGKTLQCIALIWMLLKQGPYGAPVLRKVLVVTPSSLTGNWHKEFKNWLGRERLNVFVVDSKNKPKDFARSNLSVMIISYEMCIRYGDDISDIPFDLILCDEGHRLKNDSIKISSLLSQLDCQRRVILTGTPIQNDLQEFYALINFVNPGVLGTPAQYRRHYEEPIKASREPDAHPSVREIGEQRATELNSEMSLFVLRRTQEVLDKYLPTKTEVVVFCKSSPLQRKLYTAAIEYLASGQCIDYKILHFSLIVLLRKICNHPMLVKNTPDEHSDLISRLSSMIPGSNMSVDDSGKLSILNDLLHELHVTNEKIVIVSYYQQTLDVISTLCDRNNYKYSRLDGSTATSKRTGIVEKFNAAWSETFVFLLSAKAGGVGLNLIGASRLVLFDSDWNPATDLQAMSRIWRDGQKKSVYLYRFLTAGTIEEKMFQRQISKTGLSGAIVDPNNASSIRLSDEELKDLFSLQFDEQCLTHTSLNCDCIGDGSVPRPLQSNQNEIDVDKQNLRLNQLMQWEHHAEPIHENILSDLKLPGSEGVTYIFLNKCSI